jgi:hypothetical protein
MFCQQSGTVCVLTWFTVQFRSGDRWQCNTTHALYMLDKQGYTHTHTENMQYLLHFYGNRGYANAPHCYVACTLPVILWFGTIKFMILLLTFPRTALFLKSVYGQLVFPEDAFSKFVQDSSYIVNYTAPILKYYYSHSICNNCSACSDHFFSACTEFPPN